MKNEAIKGLVHKTEFSARLLVQVLLPKVWRTIFQLDKQMLYTASLRIK